MPREPWLSRPPPARAASRPSSDAAPHDGDHNTSDPAATTALSPASMPLGRRWWIALAAVAVIATILAVVNFSSGMRWRSLALDAQERAARATADAAAGQEAVIAAREARDTAETRREVMAKHLAVSEADVAALEARIAALANDKAQAQDRGDAKATQVASAARVRSLRAQLDSCVAQVAALRTTLLVDDPTSSALDEAASAAEASCEQMGTDLAVLAAER